MTLPTPDTYTLSLHDALPICAVRGAVQRRREGSRVCRHRRDVAVAIRHGAGRVRQRARSPLESAAAALSFARSEEHTSELQSQSNLVCRLLLEKKKEKVTRSV